MSRILALLFFSLFSVAVVSAQSQPASQQRSQVFEGQTTHPFKLSYLLFLSSYYEKRADARWPLILYLHGGSLRGTDIESVRKLGIPHKLETDPNFPFVVVSPQCPRGEIWTDAEALGALLDRVQADYRVDPDRIYVSGHSMGGRGALYLAYRFPQRFAAVVALSPLSPITAWGENLARAPLWIFHGKADNLAPVAETDQLIREIKAVGGHPRFDTLPGRDHSILDIYDRPDIYKWLLQQHR
jgi:predicted peptidase